MKVAIMGSGCIGTYVGGVLQLGGFDVTFIGRQRLQDAVSAHGLTISDFNGGSVQNGVKNGNILRTVFSKVSVNSTDSDETVPLNELLHVVDGIFGANVVWLDEGEFRLATVNAMILGESRRDESSQIQKTMDGTFSPLHVVVEPDVRSLMYSKLLLNLNNGVNALCGLPLAEELADWSTVAACMHEALAVYAANGIQPRRMGMIVPSILPYLFSLPTFLFKTAAAASFKVDARAGSSMQDDLRAGKATEIDFINGEIITLGEKANIPTPANESIRYLIRRAERDGKCPEIDPAELYALVVCKELQIDGKAEDRKRDDGNA